VRGEAGEEHICGDGEAGVRLKVDIRWGEEWKCAEKTYEYEDEKNVQAEFDSGRYWANEAWVVRGANGAEESEGAGDEPGGKPYKERDDAAGALEIRNVYMSGCNNIPRK
jgi:hypothetical protein